MPDNSDPSRIARSLGFANLAALQEIIKMGAKREATFLIERQLDAENLTELGYPASQLRMMGYPECILQILGFAPRGKTVGNPPDDAYAPSAQPAPAAKLPDQSFASELQQMIDAGQHAAEMKQKGFVVHHLKAIGLGARDIYALGFTLAEIAPEYSPTELHRLGFGPQELARHFSGFQLRAAGIGANEMRMAGFTIRDLLNFGYNQHHIVSAGFPRADLINAGLMKNA